MDILETGLPGCYIVQTDVFRDERGIFIKTFHRAWFAAEGLDVDFREEYVTVSRTNVLRGMHFQTPPHDHVKVVHCAQGRVIDALVDLRVHSPAYGKNFTVELSGECGKMLYIPRGIAHGFYVTEGPAVMTYKVTTVHDREHDTGVRWDSCGIAWPSHDPVVSPRDRSFPRLDGFASPFGHYVEKNPGPGMGNNKHG